MSTVREEQDRATKPDGLRAPRRSGDFWRTADNKIWIPNDAGDLQLRLCVVAHFGVGGHRSISATTDTLRQRYAWTGLEADVSLFVK